MIFHCSIDLINDLKQFENIKARMLDISNHIKEITVSNNEWNIINEIREYRNVIEKVYI